MTILKRSPALHPYKDAQNKPSAQVSKEASTSFFGLKIPQFNVSSLRRKKAKAQMYEPTFQQTSPEEKTTFKKFFQNNLPALAQLTLDYQELSDLSLYSHRNKLMKLREQKRSLQERLNRVWQEVDEKENTITIIIDNVNEYLQAYEIPNNKKDFDRDKLMLEFTGASKNIKNHENILSDNDIKSLLMKNIEKVVQAMTDDIDISIDAYSKSKETHENMDAFNAEKFDQSKFSPYINHNNENNHHPKSSNLNSYFLESIQESMLLQFVDKSIGQNIGESIAKSIDKNILTLKFDDIYTQNINPFTNAFWKSCNKLLNHVDEKNKKKTIELIDEFINNMPSKEAIFADFNIEDSSHENIQALYLAVRQHFFSKIGFNFIEEIKNTKIEIPEDIKPLLSMHIYKMIKNEEENAKNILSGKNHIDKFTAHSLTQIENTTNKTADIQKNEQMHKQIHEQKEVLKKLIYHAKDLYKNGLEDGALHCANSPIYELCKSLDITPKWTNDALRSASFFAFKGVFQPLSKSNKIFKRKTNLVNYSSNQNQADKTFAQNYMETAYMVLEKMLELST